MPAHKTVQTPLPLAGAMGLTKYLLPWLSLRGLVVVEGLMISSLSFSQIAFLVIRHPLLFDQNLWGGFFQLSRLFLASPIACAILGGLVIGYLVTGVILPAKVSPERWNIRQTLVSTGIAVGAGLVSGVPIILGLLRHNLSGYSLVAVGFFLGPLLRARLLVNRSSAPSQEASSRLPNRREALRSLIVGIPSLAVAASNFFGAFSVYDNWRFFEAEKAHVAEFGFPAVPTNDPGIHVADLPSGRVSYGVMNPQGKNVILFFPGFYQSFHGYQPELETRLKKLNIQGIFLDRPGVGPVSTLRPGLDLAAWAHLVEEFVKIVLNNQDISIVGHSAGGLYALACAKLACVRALALVGCPPPMTVGTNLRKLYRGWHDDLTGGFDLMFMPHRQIPDAQETCQALLRDWKALFKSMLDYFGPGDEAFLTQNENTIRQGMTTFAFQGPLVSLQDAQTFWSPWPLTAADTARVSILIVNGVRDRLWPPSIGKELQTHFAPNAQLLTLDMGHFPTLKDWERIFEEVGKRIFKKKRGYANRSV